MKKIKHENELIKEAIRVGTMYMKNRGVPAFSPDDDLHFKIKAIYTLLVLDKLVQPLPKSEETNEKMRHKLAIWIKKNLPDNHSLLK